MNEQKSGKTPGLSADEEQEVSHNQPPRAAVLHEIIRAQGDKELQRTIAALWWSALAAGLSMGLSLMAMGLLNSRLPEGEAFKVIASFGYCAGFLAVILARQQLFTENTLTAVLPVMTKPTLNNFGRLLRLWTVVLFGNLCGTLLVAYVMLHLPIFDSKTDIAFLEVGRKVMQNEVGQMFAKGIISGWMIATMVWMIPSMENAKIAQGKQPAVVDARSQTDFILQRTDSVMEIGYIKKKPGRDAIDWTMLEEVIKENPDLYGKLKYKSA